MRGHSRDELMLRERRQSRPLFSATTSSSSPFSRRQPANSLPQRRRAQNRASQRAYRDRKDRRVKELETELATLAASHEKLEREHSTLCSSHAALVAAEKAWIREKRELLKEERADGGSSSSHSSHSHSDDDSWSCEGQVRSAGSPRQMSSVEMGSNGNFVVKVMICKRCFGENAQVAGLSSSRVQSPRS
jgi:hypothetical protein